MLLDVEHDEATIHSRVPKFIMVAFITRLYWKSK